MLRYGHFGPPFERYFVSFWRFAVDYVPGEGFSFRVRK